MHVWRWSYQCRDTMFEWHVTAHVKMIISVQRHYVWVACHCTCEDDHISAETLCLSGMSLHMWRWSYQCRDTMFEWHVTAHVKIIISVQRHYVWLACHCTCEDDHHIRAETLSWLYDLSAVNNPSAVTEHVQIRCDHLFITFRSRRLRPRSLPPLQKKIWRLHA